MALVVGIDYRPFTPTKCPYCGASPLTTQERSATFTVAGDETWNTVLLRDGDGNIADYVDLRWRVWTCANTHTGPAVQDLPGMVSSTLMQV